MIFYAPAFLAFFFVFLVGLALVPQGAARTWYVLVASFVFYAWWYPPYLAILIGLSVLGYVGGLAVAARPRFLPALIVLLILPLAVFKYAGFLVANVEALLGVTIAFDASWALPLGISFMTFTVISYVVDVRRGILTPEPRFREVGLFAAFFPHLVAGPILRGRELLPQLRTIYISRGMLRFGALLFAVGAAKKVVLADGIAPTVDAIYGSTGPLNSGQALLALYGFTAQIYLDFSGYTDMALGLAAIIGVRLPRNFNRPYLAGSVREFWRCWHMTLSRWLRDYIYIPLGGNRHGFLRMLLALVITMLLGGLWHGASWTFVLWGGVHGSVMALEQVKRRLAPSWVLPSWLRRLLTLHFVALAWILFRAHDLPHVGKVLSGITAPTDWAAFASVTAWPLILVAVAAAVHPVDTAARVRLLSRRLPRGVLFTLVAATLMVCAALSIGNPGTFIYFDF